MAASLAAAALCAALAQATQAFVDPLDVPARPSALAARGPLHAVTLAGRRLVAVGERGHALWSDDGGATWTQADVPVSTDLTAVHFVSPSRGWAAGHDGVVLATRDGGRTWARQLDGRGLGPDASLLGIWFADERTGFAVGAFGLVLRTDDGGASWTPWRDRTENPAALHLNAIARAAGDVWIAGERGLLLKLDRAGGRFRAIPVPYAGSFFGVAGHAGAVLAYGLRGNAFRTTDGGRSWIAVPTGVEAALTGAAEIPGGRLALVSQAGHVLVSENGGTSFRAVATGPTMPASAVAPGGADALVVVGTAGARVERLR
jgi:photosystem II stability/assembly factor-like uncharacterized protein